METEDILKGFADGSKEGNSAEENNADCAEVLATICAQTAEMMGDGDETENDAGGSTCETETVGEEREEGGLGSRESLTGCIVKDENVVKTSVGEEYSYDINWVPGRVQLGIVAGAPCFAFKVEGTWVPFPAPKMNTWMMMRDAMRNVWSTHYVNDNVSFRHLDREVSEDEKKAMACPTHTAGCFFWPLRNPVESEVVEEKVFTGEDDSTYTHARGQEATYDGLCSQIWDHVTMRSDVLSAMDIGARVIPEGQLQQHMAPKKYCYRVNWVPKCLHPAVVDGKVTMAARLQSGHWLPLGWMHAGIVEHWQFLVVLTRVSIFNVNVKDHVLVVEHAKRCWEKIREEERQMVCAGYDSMTDQGMWSMVEGSCTGQEHDNGQNRYMARIRRRHGCTTVLSWVPVVCPLTYEHGGDVAMRFRDPLGVPFHLTYSDGLLRDIRYLPDNDLAGSVQPGKRTEKRSEIFRLSAEVEDPCGPGRVGGCSAAQGDMGDPCDVAMSQSPGKKKKCTSGPPRGQTPASRKKVNPKEVPVTGDTAGPRTQVPRRRRRPGMTTLSEIRKLQRSTDLCLTFRPFLRLVREVVEEDIAPGMGVRFQMTAREEDERQTVRIMSTSVAQVEAALAEVMKYAKEGVHYNGDSESSLLQDRVPRYFIVAVDMRSTIMANGEDCGKARTLLQRFRESSHVRVDSDVKDNAYSPKGVVQWMCSEGMCEEGDVDMTMQQKGGTYTPANLGKLLSTVTRNGGMLVDGSKDELKSGAAEILVLSRMKDITQTSPEDFQDVPVIVADGVEYILLDQLLDFMKKSVDDRNVIHEALHEVTKFALQGQDLIEFVSARTEDNIISGRPLWRELLSAALERLGLASCDVERQREREKGWKAMATETNIAIIPDNGQTSAAQKSITRMTNDVPPMQTTTREELVCSDIFNAFTMETLQCDRGFEKADLPSCCADYTDGAEEEDEEEDEGASSSDVEVSGSDVSSDEEDEEHVVYYDLKAAGEQVTKGWANAILRLACAFSDLHKVLRVVMKEETPDGALQYAAVTNVFHVIMSSHRARACSAVADERTHGQEMGVVDDAGPSSIGAVNLVSDESEDNGAPENVDGEGGTFKEQQPQPVESFDNSRKLATLISPPGARGGVGMSQSDIDALLSLLTDPRFNTRDIAYRNSRECLTWAGSLAEAAGWKELDLHCDDWPQDAHAILWHRDWRTTFLSIFHIALQKCETVSSLDVSSPGVENRSPNAPEKRLWEDGMSKVHRRTTKRITYKKDRMVKMIDWRASDVCTVQPKRKQKTNMTSPYKKSLTGRRTRQQLTREVTMKLPTDILATVTTLMTKTAGAMMAQRRTRAVTGQAKTTEARTEEEVSHLREERDARGNSKVAAREAQPTRPPLTNN
ncbi:hypothetical protein CBR_g40297 [Chara braunii]|uniref:Uncharacterized protein n=1 Tax=Chara braunii TaxID=69332 RepID=A0A388K1W9_CHABU|nr:hypothetical protein CBR_g40297 [Chara braunii]|eukprot:GBG64050.1 hypothetical protein CBR_g40297 [Chara braunii]